ncbi:uncharacterized protein LOC119736763 [Patiria miniata]|uniref:Ig-like domain-containing protein n=1 Tax=Patiria miniata TaxID=46514 RepID=A0A914ASF8_PATMI|nr:uncharacterized protein LOC119736763 [Patiria miniata]
MSGLRVNVDKTTAVWIGSKKDCTDKLCDDINVNCISPPDTFKVLVSGGFVQAITGGTLFLERGHREIVPCPLVTSRQIPPGDVVAMYWYYDSISMTSLLISYFFGRVAPQNGIPEGVYDIDDEFSLVIENVTAFNEGTYYFKVKPHLKMIEEGQVEIREKVSPVRPYPTVIGCNQDHDADTCELRVRHDSAVYNLTCVMEQVKPAVELRWIRARPDGYTELELDANNTVRPVTLSTHTGSSLRNNTYSTSASIQVPSVDDDAEYACEAVGVAVGNSIRTRVRLTKTHPTTATHDSTTAHDTKATHDNVGKTGAVDDELLTSDNDQIQTSGYMNVPLVMSSVSLLGILLIMLCRVKYDPKILHSGRWINADVSKF